MSIKPYVTGMYPVTFSLITPKIECWVKYVLSSTRAERFATIAPGSGLHLTEVPVD